MKKIGLSLFAFLLTNAITVKAQNDADVLRYSILNYGSTARSLGMSNSFGALGADFSCLAINPAGIALYRKSEFTVTPFFSNRNIKSGFLGNSVSDNYFKFAFGNIGLVFTSKEDNRNSPWKRWSFGIGYNKLNDFNSRSVAQAVNASTSLMDNYLEQIDGLPPEEIPYQNPFDVNLAWQTFMIDTITINDQLYYYSQIPFAGTLQTRTVESKGGQGEWDFTTGTNYENKLFLGITLGISTLHFEQQVIWEESDFKDTIPGFEYYKLTEDLKTTGGGFNFKFGLIYKPNDAIRFGAAIHTPTWLYLKDDYKTSMNTKLENSAGIIYNSPDYIPFSYDINTPFRAIGSLGLVIGKVMALNFDYEYLNYGDARIKSADPAFSSTFTTINSAIRTKYGASNNFRIGGEYRFDNLRFRLGVQSSSTPFRSQYDGGSSTNLSTTGFSAGFGIKEKRYFIDIGYAHTETGSYLQPYSLSNKDVAGITYKQVDNRVLITLGTNF